VLLDGEVTKAPLFRRARAGMGYVTEERSVFKGLSARDNLRCGDVTPAEALAFFRSSSDASTPAAASSRAASSRC
jgi:branched-chain amino acid transport system ATP-binding protein